MKKVVFSILFISALFTIHGDVWLHKEEKIRIRLPVDWVPRAGGSIMTVSSPGEELFLLYSPLESADREKCVTEMKKIVNQFVTLVDNLEWCSEERINGYESFYFSSPGKAASIPVEIHARVIRLAKNRVILLMGIIKKEAAVKYTPLLDDICASLEVL